MLLKNYLSLILFFMFSFSVFSQDAEQDFNTQSISIFKNGSAFFLKSGTVKTQDGSYLIKENIPSALFGTLWIHSKTGELKHISSYYEEIKKNRQKRATTFEEMLRINTGKKVKLHIGKDEVIEGTVEEVVNKKDTLIDFNLIPPSAVITFKTSDRWLTLNTSEIRRIEFLEKPNQIVKFQSNDDNLVVKVEFNTKKTDQPLNLMYLENGLSWAPNYLIELIDDKAANLTLRAEVVNDAEDIENTEINFVVGVPNFRFTNKLSSLVDFFNSYSGIHDIQDFSNITMQTMSYSGVELTTASMSDFNNSDKPIGSAQEDLFFYTLKNIFLKKEGCGHYPIFKTKVKIDHIYECNLEVNKTSKYYYQKTFLFHSDYKNKVYHSIKLNNETNYPWTTGTAMVVKGTESAKPISQDQLNYTPIKGNSFVKLTLAPDVNIKHAEKEIERQDQAMRNPAGKKNYLDLVTVEGQLKIKNYKSKKIDLNIRRTIIGQLQESSIEWLKLGRVNRSGDQNATTDVCWETSVEAGEELIITYTYNVYVPD